MKIAVASDELYPVHEVVLDWLKNHGHEPVPFGALKSGKDDAFVKVAQEAALSILDGQCDEGVFFCFTGTGICMAANKHRGIRAALCTDAETARGARLWNHAQVLVLSNRLLSQDVAKEILTAWFEPFDAKKGKAGVRDLNALDGL